MRKRENDEKLIYVAPEFVFFSFCKGQDKTVLPSSDISLTINDVQPRSKEGIIIFGPNTIVRNVIQDRKGDIWVASWDGVFRFDGKSFTNITSKVSKATFFSILEDKKGNLWFGSVGSGVYRYDGKSFQHFTINEGLVNNEVVSIYEDKAGDIWIGCWGGASRYDGKSFRNYIMDGDSMSEDRTGKSFPDGRPPYEVNSIVEDKAGRFWFATRGNTFVYDPRLPNGREKAFTVFTHNGKPFKDDAPSSKIEKVISGSVDLMVFGDMKAMHSPLLH